MFDLFDRYGGGVIYVTHNRDEINRFCDWVAVMEQGSVVELLSNEIYLKDLSICQRQNYPAVKLSKATVVQKLVQLMKNIPPVVALKP